MLKTINLLLFFSIVLSICLFTSIGDWKRLKAIYFPGKKIHYSIKSTTLNALKAKATNAKYFTLANSYNDQICFLIDMSLPSGQNRFFVYDLKKDTVIKAGVVAHGCCNENWLEGRKFSNTPGGGCTSLGKYKIGKSYKGNFGLAYKLYGLDKTNSNAFKRYVVLHAHECVPETEVNYEICQSDGCPTISKGFLQQLKHFIDKSNKPVLLWIYE